MKGPPMKSKAAAKPAAKQQAANATKVGEILQGQINQMASTLGMPELRRINPKTREKLTEKLASLLTPALMRAWNAPLKAGERNISASTDKMAFAKKMVNKMIRF